MLRNRLSKRWWSWWLCSVCRTWIEKRLSNTQYKNKMELDADYIEGKWWLRVDYITVSLGQFCWWPLFVVVHVPRTLLFNNRFCNRMRDLSFFMPLTIICLFIGTNPIYHSFGNGRIKILLLCRFCWSSRHYIPNFL